jgi:hypothetical protein
VLAALLAAGCGRGIGDVSGTVKYQGKPLAGATVTFYDEKNGVTSGVVQPDGSYVVKGVAAGTARIAITMPLHIEFKGPGLPGLDEQPAREEEAGEQSPVLPKKYTDPNQSGLTCEVESGSQTHNLNLD